MKLHIKEVNSVQDRQAFKQIVDFNYEWWGCPNGQYSYDEVEEYYLRSCEPLKSALQTVNTQQNIVVDKVERVNISTPRLPLTYGAFTEVGELAGSFQIAMADDIMTRPDVYPWVVNVFTVPEFRGYGVCRAMMESLSQIMASYGSAMTTLYLHTTHGNLYEKFGWEYVEDIKYGGVAEKLYRFTLN